MRSVLRPAWHTDAVVLARHRHEVADDERRRVALAAPAQERDHARLVVAGIDPLEAVTLGTGTARHHRLAETMAAIDDLRRVVITLVVPRPMRDRTRPTIAAASPNRADWGLNHP